MHPAVVADAGGLLALAGLLEGAVPVVDEILVLDATSLLLAEYLTLRHEGAPDRARADFAIASSAVREWFPVRSVALEAAMGASAVEDDVEAAASLRLAESLKTPLVTKNRLLESQQVPVLYC